MMSYEIQYHNRITIDSLSLGFNWKWLGSAGKRLLFLGVERRFLREA